MKKFKKIYVEITNVCNLSCSFCPITARKSEFMKEDTFCKILDQIKSHTDYIYFHVKGEPLLHPQLDEFLDISSEKGFKVNITTNGTLISKTADKIMMKPALRQVNFSLHCSCEDEFLINKEEYIYNILSFVKKARAMTDVIISLRLWNLEENNETNPANKINHVILEIIEKEFKLPYKIQEIVTPSRGIKIAEKVYLNQDHIFKWPDPDGVEDNGIGFCYGLNSHAAILVDGTVVPCCLDGEGIINLGNINNSHFSEIIESERAKHITDNFSRRYAVEELCRKCGYRQRFD